MDQPPGEVVGAGAFAQRRASADRHAAQRRRRRQSGLVAQARGLCAAVDRAPRRHDPVRRTARALVVLVPRRRFLARGARRRGRAPGSARPRPHRPRRFLRHRALRRGGRGPHGEDRVRGGIVAGTQRSAERRGRPRGFAPARPRAARRGVPPSRRGDHPRAAHRRREGAPRLRPHRPRRAGGRSP